MESEKTYETFDLNEVWLLCISAWMGLLMWGQVVAMNGRQQSFSSGTDLNNSHTGMLSPIPSAILLQVDSRHSPTQLTLRGRISSFLGGYVVSMVTFRGSLLSVKVYTFNTFLLTHNANIHLRVGLSNLAESFSPGQGTTGSSLTIWAASRSKRSLFSLQLL